jgi:hypothetical protein
MHGTFGKRDDGEEPRSWRIRITCACHGCGIDEERDVIQAKWLTPVFVLSDDGSAWCQTQLCPSCAKWKPLYWLKVVFKLRIGRISDWFAPGYSACSRCHTNWHFVEGHSTEYADGRGMFPLCEQCWSELKPVERLPFYRSLYERWKQDGPPETKWRDIEFAVLNESGGSLRREN